MKTNSYIKGNTYGSAVLGLAVLFAALWLLGGCVPQREDTQVLGEVAERTTTTTESWEPPVEDEPEYDSEYEMISSLVDEVPALDGIPFDSIRTELLETSCEELDASGGDFADLGETIVYASEGNFNFDYSDAGYIAATAVLVSCPQWRAAALDFAENGY
jgi:hypothetical protein